MYKLEVKFYYGNNCGMSGVSGMYVGYRIRYEYFHQFGYEFFYGSNIVIIYSY